MSLNIDPFDKFGKYPRPEKTDKTGEIHQMMKTSVPESMCIPYCSVLQNYIAWILMEPMTVQEIVEKTAMHINTIRNAVSYLQDRGIIRIFEWKAGRRLIFVRNEIVAIDSISGRPLETNARVFFYGDISGSIVDYIIALSDPLSKITHTYKRLSGLLAHVWMRSYNARLGFKNRLTDPNPEECRRIFKEEIEKAEQFVRLLNQFLDSNIWEQETNPTVNLLDTAPLFIKHFANLDTEWLEELGEKDV